MNAKTETSAGVLDKLLLILATAMIIGGIAAFYYFPQLSSVIRALIVLAATAAGAVTAMMTVPGKELWRFILGSRIEVRKMVWPNRQETMQTTLAVFVFVLVMGVFFWVLDMFLLWATRLLTGQGG
jgi:preprotein translocase subunit SecE